MEGISATSSDPTPGPVTVRGRMRYGWAAPVLVLGVLALALAVDQTQTGGMNGWLVLPGAVAACAALVWLGFRLFRRGIAADSDGVTVINSFRTRRLPWLDIHDIGFEPVKNALGMTVFYRLVFDTVSSGRVTAEAPGGGAEPGKYLHELRERLVALRSVSPAPPPERAPEPIGFSEHPHEGPQDIPSVGPQDGRAAGPPPEPESPARSAVRAVAFGLAAALFGAGAYAAFVILTGYEVAFVSIALGAIVGVSVGAAHPTLRPILVRALSVLLALFSLVLSGFLIARQFAGLVDTPLPASLGDALSLLREDVAAGPVTLLFWGLSLLFAAASPIRTDEGDDLTREDGPSSDGATDSARRDTPEPSTTPVEDAAAGENRRGRLSAPRRWGVVVAAGAATAGIAGCLVLGTVPLGPGSTNSESSASQGPVIHGSETPASEATTMSVDAVPVGTCFNVDAGTANGDLQVVPCESAHDAEIYYKFYLDPGPYPGDAAVDATAEKTCGAQLWQYAGAQTLRFDQSYYPPDEQYWSLDRSVICYLAITANSEKLYGTVHTAT